MRLPHLDGTRTVLVASLALALFLLISLGIAACPQLERAVLLSDAVRSASPLSDEEALARHDDVRAAILTGDALDEASPEERAHIEDVGRAVDILIGIALLSLTIGFGTFRRAPIGYRTLARRVSLTIIALILAIGALALTIGFEALFTGFEALLFPEGSWIFPADSYLIELYPRIFFASMTAWTFGILLAIMTIVFVASRKNLSPINRPA